MGLRLLRDIDPPGILSAASERVGGKSKREAEEIFAEIAPAVAPFAARKIALDAEASELLEKAKALCGAADEIETLKRALKVLVEKKRKNSRWSSKRPNVK